MRKNTLPAYSTVAIRAPAKVNLGLEVRARRPDGYHEIRTLFQAVSLSDRLTLRRRSRGIRLTCRNFSDSGPENLAWKAAALFFERSGTRGGLEIELDKRIPVGGGLGGGSSDAAAVLLGACRLFRIRPPRQVLAEWAALLGSDVPFFLASGAALGTGRGEVIEPLEESVPEAAVLLYSPGFHLSTADVYRLHRPRLTRKRYELTILLRRWREGSLGPVGKALFNDLEDTVFGIQPRLAAVKGRLLAEGAAGAQVSGSGGCIFAIFPSKERARKTASLLEGEFPGRWMLGSFRGPRRYWGVVKR